ncbi:MAG: hypothetical protein JXR62_05530 [Bacilli bacterium]|nr:hypothetical protein [Bacilli bacterium]
MLKDIVLLELDGLSKTICEYTTDNYITSYAKQLSLIIYPKDKEKLIILVDKLFNWYAKEIKIIKKSEYIYNLEAHLKSYELLKTMKAQLISE